MDFHFSEEQEELRAMARSFLADHSGSEPVRKAMESELGYDPSVWERIGAELGWPSVVIPEEYGGLGLSQVELVALLEVMGESLLCAPFFSSVCLGANALLVAGSDEQKRELLPGIAEGETRATLGYVGPAGEWSPDAAALSFREHAGEFVLSGDLAFVLDGHCADLLVVAARREESEGPDGIELFALPAETAGVTRRARATMDQTRRLAELAFENVRVAASARLASPSGGHAALQKTLDLAAIALAAEQVGGAQACLDQAVAYAKEREQFGRAIGSFQAIKHKCADMMVAVESARSAAYYAGCIAAEDSDELPSVASLAKATASEAFFHCAADALQIHGGVGFTWEYDIHLYLKRAQSSQTFLGTPTVHRERVARLIGL